jgi:hypothetical protein
MDLLSIRKITSSMVVGLQKDVKLLLYEVGTFFSS